MPKINDYPEVLATLTKAGLVCLYYNSGAFGFADGVTTQSAGWLLSDDPTIRQSARDIARVIDSPSEKILAAMAGAVWEDHLAEQSVWVMPKSHWAYELDFGSKTWLPAALAEAGVGAELAGRGDGAAIEFSPEERGAFQTFVERLLTHLAGSDFMFVFSGATTICSIHHHKQLWWTTRDAVIGAALKSGG